MFAKVNEIRLSASVQGGRVRAALVRHQHGWQQANKSNLATKSFGVKCRADKTHREL
jgi:hypothetical protein